jgi:hypothetical protein
MRVALLAAGALTFVNAVQARDETVSRDGFSVHFVDASEAIDRAEQDAVLNTFFSTYRRERADFNPQAPTSISITIDPHYDGVAEVEGTAMRINPAWLRQHPRDTDLVTHEAMHIVQAYGEDTEPAWLVEGIADYVRDAYGIDNAGSGWALPTTLKPEHRYDSGYRVTAAFLKWADGLHPGLVKGLDTALRGKRYSSALWQKLSGRDVDALWRDYVKARE